MVPSNKLNLAGQRFGKLIAIKDTENDIEAWLYGSVNVIVVTLVK